LRRLELAGEFPESIPFAQAKTDATTHPTPRQNSPFPPAPNPLANQLIVQMTPP
jgi:hypothetical protein